MCIVKSATDYDRVQYNTAIDKCSGVLCVYPHGLRIGRIVQHLTFQRQRCNTVAVGLLEPKFHGFMVNFHTSTWRAHNAQLHKHIKNVVRATDECIGSFSRSVAACNPILFLESHSCSHATSSGYVILYQWLTLCAQPSVCLFPCDLCREHVRGFICTFKWSCAIYLDYTLI